MNKKFLKEIFSYVMIMIGALMAAFGIWSAVKPP